MRLFQSLLLLLPMAAFVQGAETARPADAFIDSIGVNTHLHYLDTAYGNFTSVIKPRLSELGLRHIRDGIVDNAQQMSKIQELNRDLGIRACLIASPRARTPEQCRDYVKSIGVGLVSMVEGENEPDLNLGSDWIARTRTHQRALYSVFNADSATRNLPIAGPSTTQNTAGLGSLTDALDYGNVHNYYGGHHPESGGWGDNGYGSVTWTLNYLAAPVSATKPVVATETGYHNATGQLFDHRGTDPAIIARYLPRLFLYHFNRGIVRSFPYELIDEWSNPNDPESNFGLLRNDGTPKPSFIALRNMITLLKDPGASFTASSLDLQLSGGGSALQHTLLQKRDGSYYLALWLAISSWDADQRSIIATAKQRVTITVGSNITQASACRPNEGVTWQSQTLSAGALTLDVDDRVLLVRLATSKFALKVNFQPATAPVASGWKVDSGLEFGARDGATYGWNAANDTTRDRNSTRSPDQRRDTVIHLQKPANPTAQWEVAVPNGTYQVTVVAGDPDFINSRYAVQVEGSVLLDGTPSSDQRWLEGSGVVTVTDGRLTVGSAAGASNGKLCSIDIVNLPTANN